MPELDTPLFRVTLTIAAFWLVVCGLWSVIKYNNVEFHDPSYDASITAKCDYVISWSGDPKDLQRRISDCLDTETRSAVEASRREYSELRRYAAERGLAQTVLPALGLVMIAALWRAFALFVARCWRAYIRWVRIGRTAPRKPTVGGSE